MLWRWTLIKAGGDARLIILQNNFFRYHYIMAEFVSAIIGLVAFGATVGNSLYSLIDTLKGAPNEILALSDEVTDFRSILSQLLEARSSEEFAHQSCLIDLYPAERKGRKILEEVEILIQHVLKETSLVGRVTKVDRVMWLRYAKKATKLQNALRVQKATISSFLAMGILKSSAKQGLLISQLETKIDVITESQLSLLQKQEEMVAEVKSSTRFQQISRPPKPNEPATVKSVQSHMHTTSEAWSTSHIRNAPLECFEDCPCRCHFKAVIRSPQHLSRCLGNFFFGCSNLPWSFSGVVQCSERTCRRSRQSISELRYFLPTWVGNVLAGLNITVNFHLIPLTINIQSRHTIPYDSPILVCTQEGDIQGIRKLLKSGKASLNDVDPYGLGLLYYAVYYCRRASGNDIAIKTCQLLLDMGAHPEWEDEVGNTAMENMIDDTIVSLAIDSQIDRPPTLTDFFHISVLFDTSAADLFNELVESRGFTTIHQILLGIRRDLGNLDQYLSSPSEKGAGLGGIDEPDSCGRSPLAWAVEHRWPDAVATLLRFGANPSQSRPSIHGALPLLHLAIASPADSSQDGLICVVRSLLHAGADINAIDHEGWTALHVAASWNNYQVIEELAIQGGADLDWDAVTNDGQSAIDLALGGGFNAEVQEILTNHEPHHRIVEEEESQSDSDLEVFVDCIRNFT
ncbi:ankyrin [Xylariaceae sp. AK1471]|nr:ankyrin [Xylariaceae sp. AK1471]